MRPARISSFYACSLGLIAGLQTAGGDPFINLGFDEPRTNSLIAVPTGFGDVFPVGQSSFFPSGGNYYFGSTADLLPGWTLFYGTNQWSWIAFGGYKTFTETTTAAALVAFTRADGTRDYSLVLESRTESAPFVPAEVGLSYRLHQRGDIPNDAEQIRFDAAAFGGGRVSVRINGEQLVPWGIYPFFSEYGADVRKFRGQTVDLEIVTDPQWLYALTINSITFTVPEPSTYALLALGGASCLAIAQRRRRRTE